MGMKPLEQWHDRLWAKMPWCVMACLLESTAQAELSWPGSLRTACTLSCLL